MSTKSKLLAMTEGLQLPNDPPETSPLPESQAPAAAATSTDGGRPPGPASVVFPPVPRGPVSRTAPGQMLQFRGQMLAAEGEVGQLRERLARFEGSAATRKLDPATVVPSRWANRHPTSFATPEFARLKEDIERAGGNVQPIAVRPVTGQPERYEIIFGHRRHRACTDLGLPVLAMVDTQATSDEVLFAAMDRENRERADLSPFEQGVMYRRALDEQLYPSNRRLAEALGVSHTWVAKVLQVADLPAAVVACFRSPLEIQHRHAQVLSAALERDRKAVLRRAEKLGALQPARGAAGVVSALVGHVPTRRAAQAPTPIVVGGREIGSWSQGPEGRLVIEVDPAHSDGASREAILDAIAKALDG